MSSRASGVDDQGNQVTITEVPVQITKLQGDISTISVPLAVAQGNILESFQDTETGITISRVEGVTIITIPVKDPEGVTQLTITATVDERVGIDNIRIIRADDGGREALQTSFLGFDDQGRGVFRGFSPRGLSVFGLAALDAPPQGSIQALIGAFGSANLSTPDGGIIALVPENPGRRAYPHSPDAHVRGHGACASPGGIWDSREAVHTGGSGRGLEPQGRPDI
ncbi:MAG: hypothetical protein V3U79_03310 [Dehalococcoidia bacterium]